MDKQPHLLVCITAHGFGHVAQTAPVLNALYQRVPGLQVTVRTMAPLPHLRTRIRGPFNYLRENTGDIGMLMHNALDVRAADTAAAYHKLHRDWGMTITHEARLLRELAPDFVLSNVGYLPLAGAFRAGIPCAGMSSLHWGDIFGHYCGAISGTRQIVEQIHHAYDNADAFLQLAPAMPMPGLERCVAFGPVAHVGRTRREEIDRFFGLNGAKLVLVSLGGFDGHIPTADWPRLPGVRWLMPASWRSAHPDALTLEALEMDFSDVLASSDALICKPGYGSFVEGACSGVPLLYTRRDDWPETPHLTHWLAEHGQGREVTREQLESGQFEDALQELLAAPRRAPAQPIGIEPVAAWLAQRLLG